MIKLISNGGAVIDTDDFYIDQKASGLDELVFNISVHDENYKKINEEAVLEYEQPYLVKAIDAGTSTAKIKCQLNLDELKAILHPKYTNNSATLADTIDSVLPTGWVFVDNSHSTIRRTVEGGYTPYDVIMACADIYDVVLRFDVKHKRITAYDLDNFKPLGAFVSRDLNLKEINYKGKSTGFYTRLYAYGKNNLSFSDINDGKPYVDNFQYTDKIICAYWQDDRYEVKESLLEDAKKKVKDASIPERSYECTVMDLAKTNPEMYSFQDFALFTVVRLIDDIKGISINHQVVEYRNYPYYPEKNVVTLSSTAPKIQDTVKNLRNEITNQNSGFWNVMHNAISAATDWITGVNGGYIVVHKDENDIPYEILIMDTPDISTAKNVWRWNQNGFGHSSQGYNGPYDLAMTIDGSIVANFITAGTMLADRIKGGTLILGGSDNGNGVAKVLDASGNEIVRLDKDGVYAKGKYVCGSDVYGRSIEISEGAFKILARDGSLAGRIIATSNDWIRIEAGENAVIRMLGDTGGIFIDAKEFGIDGYIGKSGTAEFSDGSYLVFKGGVLIGGSTTEGGSF